MNKEIIIDGVNVAGCEKLGETIDGITCGLGKRIRFANEIITKHNLCEDNPNCYYKQLKRLQEENMGMKKSFVDIIGNVREENYRYYKALKEADALFEVLENIMPSITLPEGNESPRAIKEARNKINEVLKDE